MTTNSASSFSSNETPVKKSAEEKTILSAKNIVKSFGKTQVLRGASYSVKAGEAVALIGANGSGKSTLLRCSLRLIDADSGEVQLFGNNLMSAGYSELRRIRSSVGFVFQKHNLVSRTSVLTNVLHGHLGKSNSPRIWYHSLAPTPLREQALECLEKVGLAHIAEKRADQLSGGQSQRVAIARALMQKPQLIVADEPVASLDPKAGEEVMDLFFKLAKEQNLAFIFVSHNLDHAIQYSDRIVGLKDGDISLEAQSSQAEASVLRSIYE